MNLLISIQRVSPFEPPSIVACNESLNIEVKRERERNIEESAFGRNSKVSIFDGEKLIDLKKLFFAILHFNIGFSFPIDFSLTYNTHTHIARIEYRVPQTFYESKRQTQKSGGTTIVCDENCPELENIERFLHRPFVDRDIHFCCLSSTFSSLPISSLTSFLFSYVWYLTLCFLLFSSLLSLARWLAGSFAMQAAFATHVKHNIDDGFLLSMSTPKSLYFLNIKNY
jgi:hypothetical protein